MHMMEHSFFPTVLAKTWHRLLEQQVGQQLFDEVVLAVAVGACCKTSTSRWTFVGSARSRLRIRARWTSRRGSSGRAREGGRLLSWPMRSWRIGTGLLVDSGVRDALGIALVEGRDFILFVVNRGADIDISTVLAYIDNGHMALPEFQRGYVWNREQVRGLFDSLYRRHPVGGSWCGPRSPSRLLTAARPTWLLE